MIGRKLNSLILQRKVYQEELVVTSQCLPLWLLSETKISQGKKKIIKSSNSWKPSQRYKINHLLVNSTLRSPNQYSIQATKQTKPRRNINIPRNWCLLIAEHQDSFNGKAETEQNCLINLLLSNTPHSIPDPVGHNLLLPSHSCKGG